MNIRQQKETWEKERLSPYAFCAVDSAGREEAEEPCEIRTVFERDRDRILHSKAFRRLKHKTQVYIAPRKDHYRTRLTHTLEVAQIARTIGRALRLNEDLIEAIALGHDLGHTPFGHIGEEVLDRVSPEGFRHYEQSLAVVEFLEPHGKLYGMNLTKEVKDGIVNHTGSRQAATLEGRVIKLADRIAYVNHDIDDSIRAGILHEEEIPRAFTDILGHSHGERIDCLIKDAIYTSMDKPEISMSTEVYEAMMGLRRFLFDEVYENKSVRTSAPKAEFILETLYHYYREDLDRLPEAHRKLYNKKNPYTRYRTKAQIVTDYLAGMTDGYVTGKFKELFIPDEWGE